MKEMLLQADGITCSSCTDDMENILRSIEGIISVRVNFTDEKIHIKYDSDIIDRKQVYLAVRKLGYNIKILSEAGTD